MQLTSLFIYLSISRWRSAERMCFLKRSLSFSPSLFPHSFPSTTSFLHLSCGSLGVWTGFQIQNTQREVRGKVVSEPGRQTGT